MKIQSINANLSYSHPQQAKSQTKLNPAFKQLGIHPNWDAMVEASKTDAGKDKLGRWFANKSSDFVKKYTNARNMLGFYKGSKDERERLYKIIMYEAGRVEKEIPNMSREEYNELLKFQETWAFKYSSLSGGDADGWGYGACD